MSDNLADFAREISKAADIVDRVAGQALDLTTEIAETELRDSTPKATGRAREAWRTEKASDDRNEIVNDVPYIHALERGHSRQAPDGILATATDRAAAKAEKELGKLLDPLGSL